MPELFLLIAMMVAVFVLMGGLGYFFRGWMSARDDALRAAGRMESGGGGGG